MNKLFVQLLLSVIVGVTAAISVSPKVHADLQKTLLQANASLHEAANVVVKNANKVATKINAVVSVKSDADLSPEDSEKVELNLKNNVNAKINGGNSAAGDLLPRFSVNQSITGEVRTTIEAEPLGLDVEAKDKSNSALNLELGSGK
jgi:hypothetical protein